FLLETNSGWSQPAHVNVPARFSKLSAQLPGASVPCSLMISYCSGVSSLRHSASVWVTGYCLVSMICFLPAALPARKSRGSAFTFSAHLPCLRPPPPHHPPPSRP